MPLGAWPRNTLAVIRLPLDETKCPTLYSDLTSWQTNPGRSLNRLRPLSPGSVWLLCPHRAGFFLPVFQSFSGFHFRMRPIERVRHCPAFLPGMICRDLQQGDTTMKDERGRDMVRLRDTTVHGDKVIQAAPDLPHGHILVAPDVHLAVWGAEVRFRSSDGYTDPHGHTGRPCG